MSRWWKTESIAGEFCSKNRLFLVMNYLRVVFHFFLCGMQGVQHVVESRGIGVNVHFAQCRAEGLRGRLTWSLLRRVATSSSPLAVYSEHVQMGEGSLGLVREFLE